jgi:hypothetical protein
VLCAGSTLLLVQCKALDEAPYKLSGAVMKLAYITFLSLAFFWIDKPWFLTNGKFATVLIIPSSWGSQLDGHPARITGVHSSLVVSLYKINNNMLGEQIIVGQLIK